MPRAAQATRRLSHIQCSLGGDAGGASHYIPAYPGISRHISDPFFCSRAPGWRGLAARASQWRDQFLAAGQAGLKRRATEARDEDYRQLQAKIGELLMENDLLYAKGDRLEASGPLARRRSTR